MATYSFMTVHATLTGPGGVINLGYGSGAAEDGSITITMAEDKNTMSVGADGSIMHSLHAGQGGYIEFALLKTSKANGQLSAMYDYQRLSPSQWGKNVIAVSDISRGDIATLTQGAFIKLTDIGYAKQGGNNRWRFGGYLIPILGLGVADVNTAALA